MYCVSASMHSSSGICRLYINSAPVSVTERDCRNDLSLVSGIVGETINKRGTVEGFFNFSTAPCTFIIIKRNVTLHRKGIAIATFLPTTAEQTCLVCY
jgi:hypothetical protein